MKFSYMKLVFNLGKITTFFTLVSSMVTTMIKQKTCLPYKQDARRALDALRDLIDAGIVDIDGVDEHQISAAIEAFENQVLNQTVAESVAPSVTVATVVQGS